MKRKFAVAIGLALIASLFFDIILNRLLGYVPSWLPYAKVAALIIATTLTYFIKKLKPFFNFSLILTTITVFQYLASWIASSKFWTQIFDIHTFAGNFGGSILLKVFIILPVSGVLFLTLKSRKEFYLVKGDLSVKANEIALVGIRGNTVSWKKLSILSGILISVVTVFLTLFTVTGFTLPKGLGRLLHYLPIIFAFALVNSFCEGVIFRSSILGTLKDTLPKTYAVLTAAIFFGVAHYYGAPSGILGVFMAGLLGWFMTRSMYETKGFLSSWIIHFMQDFVIFSSILLLGGFV